MHAGRRRGLFSPAGPVPATGDNPDDDGTRGPAAVSRPARTSARPTESSAVSACAPAASPVRRAPAARKTATTRRNAHRPRGSQGSASRRHIAKTTTRLCSPAARVMTGQAIAVDGGLTVRRSCTIDASRLA
ncbi:SDR family oxidoreductase [Burkholderia cepacia]|uniref:SDR family oxidoreductase n=1 Tax=Burkholderia cepacia TaxID=292 RepID=UPI0039BEFBC2